MTYNNRFVLSVLHDGSPLREFGSRSNRKVSMPFNSEYKIRLRNKNDRACTARILVDGAKLSSFGDIILQPGGYSDLERFVTESMSRGKKLKFVSLDHPDVNDPHSSDNGIIKVEFRLATNSQISIDPFPWDKKFPEVPQWPDPPKRPRRYGSGLGSAKKSSAKPDWSYTSTLTTDGLSSNNVGDVVVGASSYNAPNTEAGATVEGRRSSQSFTYGDIDVEDSPSAVLKLKIVGVKNAPKQISSKRFCTNCGYAIRKGDRFCSKCGNKFYR